ncbi:hypothetical protein SAMN05192558_11511 [Actinokineospora alba]|uniref:Uncharacterized protein n=1 Tax=Actinokineospora alba TaxID=504798 RepID=A0A1H0VPC1_9PSEU|nr:hypothetical protein [Actinokineospora alba]TDP70187.1 hypothetical protein C8E96_5789 [Actinokineospora alba]SDI37201.1 hypothetical protein SAMN05421871_104362 [Actinokineospora alba]SDP80367.1 hypothetical protein SAMN05192558_11511 [Actinokineospora alba]
MTTTTMRLQPVTFGTAVRFAGNLLYALVAAVLFGRSDFGEAKPRSRPAPTNGRSTMDRA